MGHLDGERRGIMLFGRPDRSSERDVMAMDLDDEDQAFLDCLRQVAGVYDADVMFSKDQREALAMLISTYTCEPDSDLANALSNLLRSGMPMEDIRQQLAFDAGIIDVAQLKFFTSVDQLLSQGKLRTTSLRGLNEEEIIELVQH